MALHPLKLPASSALLGEIVELLGGLLHELAKPDLVDTDVTTEWVQQVWVRLDKEWVRKFCLRGQLARIQAIAGAATPKRAALHDEFRKQNDFETVFNAGGDFRDLASVLEDDAALTNAVTDFFKQCYAFLGATNKWKGYVLPKGRTISKSMYSDDYRTDAPTREVCPYCDGNIGTPQLDHYLFKQGFPLLACSPFNLFPICQSCNDVATAKGDRPAISMTNPRSMKKWLHPLFRPATAGVKIKLNGTPKSWIPRLLAVDRVEQARLCNHTNLIKTLSKRWTYRAAATFETVIQKVQQEKSAMNSIEVVLTKIRADYEATRTRRSFALIDTAVCEAILEGRQNYFRELEDSNPPRLV